MSNFWTRVITGALFVAVMMGCIWWSYWSSAVLFLVISVLGLWEFYLLLEKNNYKPQKYFGITGGISIFIFISYESNHPLFLGWSVALLLIFFLLFFVFFITELFRKTEKPFQNIGFTILGLIYIPIPFLVWLPNVFKHGEEMNLLNSYVIYNPDILLGFFFLVWSNDTFAYLVGRAFGKHKLFERISPKKTWEGFIGGILCTQIIAYLISIYFTELAPMHWHIVALIVSIFGTLGDLVESMFKRSLGVKDSGNILPGHGGILDRFDGVLLSSPFVVTYLMLVR